MIAPVEKASVMVTGVGAVIGQGIIKSLKASDSRLRIVGIDMNPHAVGFSWSDISYSVPSADSDEWLDVMSRICHLENVRLVLIGIEQDLRSFIKHRARIVKEIKATVLINSEAALQVGFDKWHLYQFATEHQFAVPPTCLAVDSPRVHSLLENSPILFKPRAGIAGKGIYRVHNMEEFDYIGGKVAINDYICQKYIGHDDEEYTASCFGSINGTISGPIILKRRLNYGSTFEAETVYDSNLASTIRNLSTQLSIIGPTNFQFRKIGDEYILIEVNPRFSSSTSIKTAFGFNEPLMAVQNFLSGISLPEQIPLKKGRCSRYLEDDVQYYENSDYI